MKEKLLWVQPDVGYITKPKSNPIWTFIISEWSRNSLTQNMNELKPKLDLDSDCPLSRLVDFPANIKENKF